MITFVLDSPTRPECDHGMTQYRDRISSDRQREVASAERDKSRGEERRGDCG